MVLRRVSGVDRMCFGIQLFGGRIQWLLVGLTVMIWLPSIPVPVASGAEPALFPQRPPLRRPVSMLDLARFAEAWHTRTADSPYPELDLNRDGIIDTLDLSIYLSLATTPETWPSDVNRDLRSNWLDLVLFTEGWNLRTTSPFNDPRDLNHDTAIDANDLLLFQQDWRTIVPTPTPVPVPGKLGDTIIVPLPNLPPGARPLEMVLLKAGSFTMGSPANDPDRDSDELPQHTVTLTYDFYIGKYEITQAQWEAVMGSNPSTFPGRPDNPVDQLSYRDGLEFIRRLNQKYLGKFRHPTEAEWEYACRAGTTTRFYWGNDTREIDAHAWYQGNTASTMPVGSLAPNVWGLHDMAGNVFEWCSDWMGPYPAAAQTNPVGPPSGFYRILRGGSWFHEAKLCRSASRFAVSGDVRFRYYGLRLVRTFP